MKERKTIRFEDSILKDIEAFAGTHKLKDQDGNFDFSNAIHTRYMELLQKEREFNQAMLDVTTWKNYAKGQEATSKTYCEKLDFQVSPTECQVCAEKRLHPGCSKTRPEGVGVR